MSVTVTPVSGRRDLDAFIKLPFRPAATAGPSSPGRWRTTTP